MKKTYLEQDQFKEGDIIYFEMPPFCSGEYSAKVYKNKGGVYINKKDDFFQGCRDYRLNKPYWREEYQ